MKCLLVMFAFLAQACSTRYQAVFPLEPEKLSSKPSVIFIPGFYGSVLTTPKGRRIFYSATEALFGRVSLSLFQEELGTPRGPEATVEGVLGAVPVVPWLYEQNVYAEFLEALARARPDAQVIALPYDWRADLHPAVAKLDELVKTLEKKGVTSIDLVAHSMGGQVASYYLGYGTQPVKEAKLNWEGAKKIRRVLLLGVPFQGSMIGFRSFLKGTGLPLAKFLLPPDTMSSFPSLFKLLPRKGTFLSPEGKPVELPLFDPALWKEHGLGLLARRDLPAEKLEARERFVREWLSQSRAWSDRIQLGEGAPQHLKILNVVGRGQQTLGLGYYDPIRAPRPIFDPEDVEAKFQRGNAALFIPGDETITVESAELPPALKSRFPTLHTTYSHGQLFLDPAVEREYKVFLQ